MDNSVLEQLNSKFNLDDLIEDIENSDAPLEFVEVPHGQYEVKVASMEMGLTSEKAKNPGQPMLKVRFKIIAGEYKGQSLFYNQVLNKGFCIYNANKFLESLRTSVEVEFKNFKQYNDVINACFEIVNGEAAEFALNYTEEKGFDRFEITQRF